jgi:hypothetical protein
MVLPFWLFISVLISFGIRPQPQSRIGAAAILAIVSALKILIACSTR